MFAVAMLLVALGTTQGQIGVALGAASSAAVFGVVTFKVLKKPFVPSLGGFVTVLVGAAVGGWVGAELHEEKLAPFKQFAQKYTRDWSKVGVVSSSPYVNGKLVVVEDWTVSERNVWATSY
jgi:hypothetical protein